jgi:tetratricopeptide (TPR) repeat protein
MYICGKKYVYMITRRLILVAVAVCCLGSTGPASAQAISSSAEIAGLVRETGSQEPVVGARVDLISPDGMAAPTHFTDTNGEFHFSYIKDGDYRVNVRKIGYQDAQVEISVVAGRSSNVQVELRPTEVKSDSDAGTTAGPAGKISAHELEVPDKARGDYTKGKGLMDKQDYAGAIGAFQKAIQEFPGYYEAYAKMGVAQYMAGQAAEARQSLQKSIDMSGGKYAEAMFDLADVLNDVGEYADAESVAGREISLEESSWRGYFERARALLGLKKYAEAEQSANKCVELNARHKDTYVVLTNVHIEMREYRQALKDIDAYLKIDSTSSASEHMRATRAQVAKAIANAQSKANRKPQ